MRKLTLIYSTLILVGISLAMTSCSVEKISSPRPHSYPRIEFLPHEYTAFQEEYCPVSFEYPTIAQVNQKKFFFNDHPDHQCWFNLSIAEFDATLYFTYHPLSSDENLEALVDDSFTMVSKHNSKANSRAESKVTNPQGLQGVIFEIGGPVASPIQFYLTDEENHFIRASLYYNNSSANDSLHIISEYIKEDIIQIINTAEFM